MKNYPYSNSNCSVTNNNTQDCSLNNASMKNMHRSMNRNQLMEHINQVSFAVDEVNFISIRILATAKRLRIFMK